MSGELESENERLREGLRVVQSIGCGIPGHAVAVGCDRALAAQAVLGGWNASLGEWGKVPEEAWDFARKWVDDENAARAPLTTPED